MMIRMVGGWVFLLVPAHLGSPGQRAVKWLLCVCCHNEVCVRNSELHSTQLRVWNVCLADSPSTAQFTVMFLPVVLTVIYSSRLLSGSATGTSDMTNYSSSSHSTSSALSYTHWLPLVPSAILPLCVLDALSILLALCHSAACVSFQAAEQRVIEATLLTCAPLQHWLMDSRCHTVQIGSLRDSVK